jgi:O-antigen ligase
VDGSSGYHRALLVDQFVRHFWDWWLVGTHDNGNWGWDMWDIANQYVNEGERGGLVALVCFFALIVLSFRNLAKARTASAGDRNKQWFLWLLGASLFANCVAFFGVDYFDQTRFAWYTLLVMMVAATAPLLQVPVTSDSQLTATMANAPVWAKPRLGPERPAPLKSLVGK